MVGSEDVPNVALADVWTRLADAFKDNPRVIFGLMNEPHGMPTEQWKDAANAGIAAIRGTKATNLILVCGNGYSGGHSWAGDWYGTPNAKAMLEIKDPGNNFAFEIHQYLDPDSSGTKPIAVSANIGSERLAGVTRWLRENKRRGFLGEFASAVDAASLAALDDMSHPSRLPSGRLDRLDLLGSRPLVGTQLLRLHRTRRRRQGPATNDITPPPLPGAEKALRTSNHSARPVLPAVSSGFQPRDEVV